MMPCLAWRRLQKDKLIISQKHLTVLRPAMFRPRIPWTQQKTLLLLNKLQRITRSIRLTGWTALSVVGATGSGKRSKCIHRWAVVSHAFTVFAVLLYPSRMCIHAQCKKNLVRKWRAQDSWSTHIERYPIKNCIPMAELSVKYYSV